MSHRTKSVMAVRVTHFKCSNNQHYSFVTGITAGLFTQGDVQRVGICFCWDTETGMSHAVKITRAELQRRGSTSIFYVSLWCRRLHDQLSSVIHTPFSHFTTKLSHEEHKMSKCWRHIGFKLTGTIVWRGFFPGFHRRRWGQGSFGAILMCTCKCCQTFQGQISSTFNFWSYLIITRR